MNLKILYLILFILMVMPIGLCEIIKDDINLNNTKIYDDNKKIISIYDKNNEKSMDIKLISTILDINKFIKIVEITNYIEYIPDKNDFITKTKKIYGKNDVYKIEYFIEKCNYTFENIIINETIFNNKTGKNETKLINKSIVKDKKTFWIEFEPYNKQILKNETFKLKIIHYKKPELGFFKIQTIPIFKKIECKEFTWWDGNWNLRRPIVINNTNGDNIINYQLKSVNLSQYQINASSTRIINESSGLIQNHWNETINSNGNLEFVWCNFSEILNNTWINETYYIYYQSNSIVNSVSNGSLTFLFFDDFNDASINILKWDITSDVIESDGLLKITGKNAYRRAISNNVFGINTALRTKGSMQFGGFGNNQDICFSVFDSYKYGYTTDYPNADKYHTRYNTSTFFDIGNSYTEFHIWEVIRDNETNTIYKIDDINIITLGTSLTTLYNIVFSSYGNNIITSSDWVIIRSFINNEPELWTVGNIEYPEGLNMTCNLKIITHLTNKKVQIVDMNASIVNESYTNECINLTYDSYIVYMSNPVKISSFTELLNILDNFLVQFLLFIFLIIIATLFYVFIQIVKKKGFKL